MRQLLQRRRRRRKTRRTRTRTRPRTTLKMSTRTVGAQVALPRLPLLQCQPRTQPKRLHLPHQPPPQRRGLRLASRATAAHRTAKAVPHSSGGAKTQLWLLVLTRVAPEPQRSVESVQRSDHVRRTSARTTVPLYVIANAFRRVACFAVLTTMCAPSGKAPSTHPGIDAN